jgi:hypothetical protein
VGVGLSALVLAVVGCNPGPSAQSPGASNKPPAAERKDSPPPAAPKLFANWPTPAGALLFSGEQLGYLEPCGCTAGQRGGLARRFDMIERLRKQGWKLVELDLGSLINDPNERPFGGPEQTKIKFDYALKALAKMGYDSVALSPADLKLTVLGYMGQILQLGDRPWVVCANVIPNAELGLKDKYRASFLTQAGPIKIGVTAVVDPAAIEKLNDPDKTSLITTKEPSEVLPKILEDFQKAGTHVQVLMVQGPPELARRLARTYTDFDVVASTSPNDDPERDAEMLNDGKTMLVQVGHKGQYVGVVGMFQDPKQKYRYQRVQLGEVYDKKFEPMRKLIDEDYQEELKRSSVIENFQKLPYSDYNAPEGAAYVGAEACKGCHPNTFVKWSSTRHAKAYEVLVRDPHDARRKRENDAECVTCHTTGFEYTGGFRSTQLTPYLKGNQCENCHGPGSKHAEQPDNKDYLAAIKRSIDEFDKHSRCIRCHDADNSPHGFDVRVKWGEITHKKLDTYNDPKVHQGITTKPGQAAAQ